MIYHIISIRMVINKKTRNKNCSCRVQKKGNPCAVLMEMKIDATQENSMEVTQRKVACDPAIKLFGIYPEEINTLT